MGVTDYATVQQCLHADPGRSAQECAAQEFAFAGSRQVGRNVYFLESCNASKPARAASTPMKPPPTHCVLRPRRDAQLARAARRWCTRGYAVGALVRAQRPHGGANHADAIIEFASGDVARISRGE